MLSVVTQQTTKLLSTPVYDLVPLPSFVRRLFPRSRIVHTTYFGPRAYVITQNYPEQTSLWVLEIEEIIKALTQKDLIQARQLLGGGNYRGKIEEVYLTLIKEGLVDKEDVVLASIALWVQRNQNNWVGTWVVIRRIARGGFYDVTSFVKSGIRPSCLDTTVLFEVLAREFGISGAVKKTPSPYGHRYWQSQSGRIVDVLWGSWRAGLYRDEKHFREITHHKFLRYKLRKKMIQLLSTLILRLGSE